LKPVAPPLRQHRRRRQLRRRRLLLLRLPLLRRRRRRRRVKVPDIGDFADVPVIELFVKVGDSIKVDDAIATLESDKATMDVPPPWPARSRKCWSSSAPRSAKARSDQG
jgi:biotin carboxyl carrier protein